MEESPQIGTTVVGTNKPPRHLINPSRFLLTGERLGKHATNCLPRKFPNAVELPLDSCVASVYGLELVWGG
jgi:hypothetical protein